MFQNQNYQNYSDKYPNIGKKWDEAENNKLIDLFRKSPRLPIESIAYEMGRSVNSIRIQGCKVLQDMLQDGCF